MRVTTFLLLFIFPSLAFAQHNHGAMADNIKSTTVESGVGNINHPVSTKNAEAQKYFNQGLAYIYAFNHEEAVRSFKHGAELDADLAMAYWGIALARGSNYNVTADAEQLKEAWANLQKAVSLESKASA